MDVSQLVSNSWIVECIGLEKPIVFIYSLFDPEDHHMRVQLIIAFFATLALGLGCADSNHDSNASDPMSKALSVVPNTRKGLAGISAIRVVAEDVDEGGVTSEQLDAWAERQLRQQGFHVTDQMEENGAMFHITVNVHLLNTTDLAVYDVSVELLQRCVIVRTGETISARTWSNGTDGGCRKYELAGELRDVLNHAVSVFATDCMRESTGMNDRIQQSQYAAPTDGKGLQGISGINLVIEDVDRGGLTKEQLDSLAERQLRREGLPVADQFDENGAIFHIIVSLHPLSTRDIVVYDLSVEVMQRCVVARTGETILASTWTDGTDGGCAKHKLPAELRDVLNHDISDFANAYYRENASRR